MRRIALFTFLFFTIASLTALAGPPKNPKTFRAKFRLSAKDWESLRSGEILIRNPKPTGHFGGTAIALLHQPHWRLWQTITDFPKYPEFYPRHTASEILEEHPGGLTLKTKIHGGGVFTEIINESEIRFYTKSKRTVMMTWEAKTTNLKTNYGTWLLEKNGNSQTLLIYQMTFDLEGVPADLVQREAILTLRKNIEAISDRADSARYALLPNRMVFVWKPPKRL